MLLAKAIAQLFEQSISQSKREIKQGSIRCNDVVIKDPGAFFATDQDGNTYLIHETDEKKITKAGPGTRERVASLVGRVQHSSAGRADSESSCIEGADSGDSGPIQRDQV